jgi:SLT domain-containing protein
MALAETAEVLLRIQSAAQAARRELVDQIPVPGASELIREIERLETMYAQAIARRLGATPMALGGLVSQPTFALLGEAGPEMVIPLKPKKKRKVTKYQREWGRQLKVIKKTSRLKNGSYRSGWDRAKEFSKAHKMTKKAMK